jgi:hypothetical protein
MILAVIALAGLIMLGIARHAVRSGNVVQETYNPCGGRLLRDDELKSLFRNTAIKGGLGSYTAYFSDGSGQYVHGNNAEPFKFVVKDQQICTVLENKTVTACHSYVVKNGKVFDIVDNAPPFPPAKPGGGLYVCVETHFFRPEGHPSRSG